MGPAKQNPIVREELGITSDKKPIAGCTSGSNSQYLASGGQNEGFGGGEGIGAGPSAPGSWSVYLLAYKLRDEEDGGGEEGGGANDDE